MLGYSEGETDWGATIGYASIYKDEEQDDELVITIDEHCPYDTDSIYLYSSYTYLYDEDQQRILCIDRDKTIVKIRDQYTRHKIKICTENYGSNTYSRLK